MSFDASYIPIDTIKDTIDTSEEPIETSEVTIETSEEPIDTIKYTIDTSEATIDINSPSKTEINPLFCFIITRHVRDEKTNQYWNICVQRIRCYYPNSKIFIIDDNSQQLYIKSFREYKNIEVIQSEFIGRGELLPYYYFDKYKWFPYAVIVHDSVFFHKRVAFEKLLNHPVLPLWHFKPDKENIVNSFRIASTLTNNYQVIQKLNFDENFIQMFNFKNKTSQGWDGCFGVQSFISHKFISLLQKKYNIFNMIKAVTCRLDRCSLERIMSILFFEEYKSLEIIHSLFGDIFRYQNFGYSFDSYISDLKKGVIPRYVVKVWTGR